ncbi:MAG: ComF family protein [Patescibacteria group bacterium]|nr:ComF family protein [Patescibacteria group bacterium]
MPFLNTIISKLLNIVFPVTCVACGKNGAYVCLSCISEFPPAERESAKWIFPVFDYRHPPVKKALWLLKYKNKKKLAETFAEVLYGKLLEELSELSIMENFRSPILIPIPLSKKRYKERGYNQAELIAKELIKINNLRHGVDLGLETGVLIKPKDTEHQARIRNRSERLKNIIGSFAVKNPEVIDKKNIILIDDILTTGATLTEARRVLRKAGARKVVAFTVAH